MKKKSKIIISCAAVLIAVLAAWTVWGNVTVGTTHYNILNDEIPAGFDGYKIAQISDLHNASFGKENGVLLGILRSEAPDIIVITGDMVDRNHTDIQTAVRFAENAVDIADCYYITGNHEAGLDGGEYAELVSGLENAGVIILDNETVTLEKDGEEISLTGISDPCFEDTDWFDNTEEMITERKMRGMETGQGYNILLAHKPEFFGKYTEAGFDLVISGHAHGGQLRIPLVGGVYAPGQGLFPEYDGGVYEKNGACLVVSRGLGNSAIPVRVNNRPEVVIITLKK